MDEPQDAPLSEGNDPHGPAAAFEPPAAAGLYEAPAGPRLAPFDGFVVGIGASAGGLDALERLFSALPADTGAAYVVIQHLAPDHKSMMDNLLARHTAMPVRVAEHEMPLAADAVFLIPPGKTMRVHGDRLLLAPKPEHGLSLPIDIFFASLAEQCADRAIAVVLSGTGSDGSRGLAAVNAGGGFVFVQDPLTAKFDGMPRSAIATGQVDVVAPAAELALRLSEHLLAPRLGGPRARPPVRDAAIAEPLDGILEQLLASSGIDFREYKPNTVMRRIERRMQVLRTGTMGEYLTLLAASPEEQALLRRELLIPVTRFFRDADAFEQLAERVIDPLVLEGPANEPLRVWVACCATGEEAYSIAILFAEAARRLGRSRPVKIFATDIEASYLEHAAAGLYPAAIAAEVSPQRLQQFFIDRGDLCAVRPEIRQMVIFARHNLVADPPFTRMDLVSCRNALIYLQPVAQEHALQRLHYALRPGGHLFLGPSESLGGQQRAFVPLPGRHKIYRLVRRERLSVSLDATGGRHRSTAALRGAESRLRAGETTLAVNAPAPPDVVTMGQRQLMGAYAPPTLLVGPNRELLHLWGDATGLLQLGPGEATLDVLRLLPRELSWAAALLFASATAEGRVQRSAPLRLGAGDAAGAVGQALAGEGAARGGRLVRLVVRPLAAGLADPLDAAGAAASAAAAAAAPGADRSASLAAQGAVSGTAQGGSAAPGEDELRDDSPEGSAAASRADLLSTARSLRARVARTRSPQAALAELSDAQLEVAAVAAGVLLLTIEPVAEPDAGASSPAAAAVPAAALPELHASALDLLQQRRIEALERELALSHDTLQATVEELETANEELQATNEELMAANEELQSTNEELQSVNEELYTVNAEYQEKVDVLNSLNADLENVSKAAAIPTLFVDEHLHLTRFTPEVSQLFKVKSGDRGRSLEDFAHVLDYPELFPDLRRTLASGVAHERETRSADGRWWLARMQPYRGHPVGTSQPAQSRAVLSFFDVTSVKDSQRLQAVLDSLAEHVAVIDRRGGITLVNAAWRRFAGDNGDPAMQVTGPGSNYLEVCARAALADPDARRALDGLTSVLSGREAVFTMQYPCHSPEARRWFLMHVAAVPHHGGGAVVSHIDITPWAEPASGAPAAAQAASPSANGPT
jgi:chemotaxis methyl-accepting protein methylase